MLSDILDKALKGGWRTSEFWLAVLALLLPYISHLLTDQVTTQVATWAGTLPGVLGMLVVAAYTLGRSWVKAHAVTAALNTSADTANTLRGENLQRSVQGVANRAQASRGE